MSRLIIFCLSVLLVPQFATADLVTRNLNVTLSGEDYAFDLDQDGQADFFFADSGQGESVITPTGGNYIYINGLIYSGETLHMGTRDTESIRVNSDEAVKDVTELWITSLEGVVSMVAVSYQPIVGELLETPIGDC